MTPDELTQLLADLPAMEAREEAATEGPWVRVADVDEYGDKLETWNIPDVTNCAGWLTEEDSVFIVAVRTDLPRLLAAVRDLADALEIRQIITETEYEVAPIPVHFSTTHMVIAKDGGESLCYCTDIGRAQVIADQLNRVRDLVSENERLRSQLEICKGYIPAAKPEDLYEDKP